MYWAVHGNSLTMALSLSIISLANSISRAVIPRLIIFITRLVLVLYLFLILSLLYSLSLTNLLCHLARLAEPEGFEARLSLLR